MCVSLIQKLALLVLYIVACMPPLAQPTIQNISNHHELTRITTPKLD